MFNHSSAKRSLSAQIDFWENKLKKKIGKIKMCSISPSSARHQCIRDLFMCVFIYLFTRRKQL